MFTDRDMTLWHDALSGQKRVKHYIYIYYCTVAFSVTSANNNQMKRKLLFDQLTAAYLVQHVPNFMDLGGTILKTDTRAAVNHNGFYHSCQYMLHVSVVLTIFRHLNT